MLKIKTGALILVLSLSIDGYAYSVHSFLAASKTHAQMALSYVDQGTITIQGGGFLTSQSQTQSVKKYTKVGDDFTVTYRHGFSAIFGLGYYAELNSMPQLPLQVGLNLFYLPKTSVAGKIMIEKKVATANYHYYLSHFPVYFMLGSSVPLTPLFNLVYSVGIGPNFTKTATFKEKPFDGAQPPSHQFAGHTAATFSATTGIGFNASGLIKKMPIGCGYQFFYLGKGQFNHHSSQLRNTLHSGPSYANSVLCSISMHFPAH